MPNRCRPREGGDPVPTETSVITGSSAFADDDSREFVIAGYGSSLRANLDLNQRGWPPMLSHKLAKTMAGASDREKATPIQCMSRDD